MRLDPIEYIEVDNLVLYFDDEVREDGARIATLVNRNNGEVREQMVYSIPQNPKWRDTVARRMVRIHEDYQTPQVLLNGVR